MVEVAARSMGMQAILDKPCLRLSECSRWPMRGDCGQDCLRQIEACPSELRFSAVFNSYLLESTARFRTRNYAWTRIENAERSNELLIGENPLPPNFREEPIGRVQAYTFGYDHDFDFIPRVASAIGAQFTTYGVADALKPIYGSHPLGVALFLRLRPFSGKER